MQVSDVLVWHIDKPEEQNEREAAFINGIISWISTKIGKNYKRVLDVACGHGRLHPYLRRYGYDVQGFDFSDELVGLAREKGNHCWKGDMKEEKSYRGVYDVVLSWFTSFGYFSDSENLAVLKNFAHALEEGGIAIIDIPNAQYFESKPDTWMGVMKRDGLVEIEESVRKKVGKGFLSSSVFRHYEEVEWGLRLREELRIDIRIYHPEEMEELMRSAGFSEVLALETLTFRPVSAKSPRVTYIGVKHS